MATLDNKFTSANPSLLHTDPQWTSNLYSFFLVDPKVDPKVDPTFLVASRALYQILN